MVDFEENRSLIENDGYNFLKNYKDTSYNEIDIFSPCATGGDLNLEFINFNKSNKVNCVLGAANNQLANPNIENNYLIWELITVRITASMQVELSF